MALLADRSLDAGSNLVEGTGTSSITFTMPGNVVLSVESVVAHIDTTAAGATTATLTIRDSSGVVIAEVAQSGTIDAGESDGVATWALRLSGDTGSGDGIEFDKFPQVGGFLRVETTGTPSSGGYGIELKDDGNAVHVTSDDGAGGGEIFLTSPFVRADTAGVSFRLLDSGETFFTGAGGASWEFDTLDLEAPGGSIFLLARNGTGYPQVYVDAETVSHSLFLSASDSTSKFARLTLDSGTPQILLNVTDGAGAGDISATVGHDLTVDAGRAVSLKVKAGGFVRVLNHLGAEIFRVDETGALHGLTGQTLTFDL